MAPTPVPTITAVGVARPSAQGHAIANTEKNIKKYLIGTLTHIK